MYKNCFFHFFAFSLCPLRLFGETLIYNILELTGSIRIFKVNNTKENIASMILNHLRENPDAGDTLEGISKWWLEAVRVNRSVDEVSSALENLVKTGVVTRQVVGGSNPLYKICKKP